MEIVLKNLFYKRILVAGGVGLICSNLCEKLLAQGC